MAVGILAVLDDIAALMDDVALATKVATRKTVGILGDDLAVNAEKATGFLADRELPVLWAITKGSLLNKLIIVPIALLLNAFFPVAITVILLGGGCYLAYEGAEKIIDYLGKLFTPEPPKSERLAALARQHTDAVPDQEKEKIKSAVMTDFILSVEIVILALGTTIGQEITVQIVTVSIIALLATVGVYGLVALIVRTDDAGRQLIEKSNGQGLLATVGRGLVGSLPIIIKLLTVVGTIALLLVAGGIFVHNIHYLETLLPGLAAPVKELGIGLVAGLILAGLVALVKTLRRSIG